MSERDWTNDGEEWKHEQSIPASPSLGSLDAWLAAEREGRLPEGNTHGHSWRLPTSLRDKLSMAARQRRRTWPRLCRSCRREFRSEHAHLLNCPTCRATKNAARIESRRAKLGERFEPRPCKCCGHMFEPVPSLTVGPRETARAVYCDPCKAAGRTPGRVPNRLRSNS